MLSTISSHHAPSPSFRRRSSKCPAVCGSKRPTDRNSFHLLASLQIAVRSLTPAQNVDTDLLSGTNSPNLRKQGQLALTFALANHITLSGDERIALANRLEEAVDKAFVQEDYRARVYRLGGVLAADADCGGQRLVEALVSGKISVTQITIGDL